MKANELRIGNWVWDNDLNDCYKIQSCDIEICELIADVFKPIPLTEEWGVRCGVKTWRNEGEDCESRYVEMMEVPRWIKYVHELQNWYYWTFQKTEIALTGEELTYKK